MEQKEKEKILSNFLDKLINNQEDLPEDIQEIVNEQFWDLLQNINNESKG